MKGTLAMTDLPIDSGAIDTDGQATVAPTARPRDRFFKPKHGRGLLARRWGKGESGNPGGRNHVNEARRLAAEKTPAAMRKLVELLDSPDHRVAYMAATAILDRSMGKVGDGPPPPAKPDLPGMGVDLRRLNAEELVALAKLLDRARSGTSDTASPARR
jgi:hypothetical protein